MAKFSVEQTVAVISVQQLIHEWGYELDVHNGDNIADLVTEDCTYVVGGTPRQGRAEVVKFYEDRYTRLSNEPTGVPIHRHALCNLRVVNFDGDDQVSIAFSLVYFTTAGVSTGTDHADPAAVADVRMTCRREEDGHWRIAKFDSNQTFRRVPR